MQRLKVTVSQRLIWTDQMFSPRSPKYNIGGYARLEGPLQYDILNKAVMDILRSQEIYAAVFEEKDGVLTYTLSDRLARYSLPLIDFTSSLHPAEMAQQWMENDFATAFELQDNVLFSFALLKTGDQQYCWYAKIHHLIGDGWSFKLLLNDAATLYSAYLQGDAPAMPVYKYSDYAAEDAAYYASADMQKDKEFWLNEYREIPPALFPPKQQQVPETTAGSETLFLDQGLKQQLQQIADQHKVSLFQLIIGVLCIYFGRTCQQTSLAIGVPVLNRTRKIYRQTSGVFMNLLAVKFNYDENATLEDTLRAIKQQMSACLRHQRYQYGNLLNDLQLLHQRKSLYDIRVSYEDFDFTSGFGGLNAAPVALSNHGEVDTLSLYVREYNGQGFDVRFVYNHRYFTGEDIREMINRLDFIFRTLPDNIALPAGKLPLMDAAERDRILQMATGPRRDNPYSSFPDAWRDAVAAYPAHIAVSGDEGQLTYLQLQERAGKLCSALLARQIKPGDKVAVLLPRNGDMIAGLIGAMMSGATYVPMDPAYPEQRLRYMLQDADCSLILTTAALQQKWYQEFSIPVLHLEAVWADKDIAACTQAVSISPAATAYIIYTSGSTGQPKGVCIPHSAMADYISTFVAYFDITAADTLLQQSSVSFDTSVEEIFPVLTSGGRLHILSAYKDPGALKETLATAGITVLSTNPYMVDYLNQTGVPAALRILISGGDVLKRSYVSRLQQGPVRIYNTYGPTESTVCATYHALRPNDTLIPIGTPIANREVYILDHQQQLQPLGVAGEICIGGAGLASGYLNNPEQTEAKFIPHPFRPGEKLYRTGDAGVLLPDGEILFTGRRDQQLSFRGYRIEPQEIEKAINTLEGVQDSLVLIREIDGYPVLVAYIVGKGQPAQWRRALSQLLPAFMVPGSWMILDAFPLSPNGKVDTKALPEVSEQHEVADNFVAAATPDEEKLSAVWQTVLRRRHISVTDSFFELGGHSLNAMQLLSGIRDTFRVAIQLKDILTHDTIRLQAALLAQLPRAAAAIAAAPVMERYPLTHAQERMWLLSQLEDASHAYHISGALRLKGRPDTTAVQQALFMVIDRHESLRTIFHEEEGGRLGQQILPAADVCPHVMAYTEVAPDALPEKLQEILSIPFDLTAGPLIRATLIKLSVDDHILLYVMHHIISDGWSMEIIFREFIHIYNQLTGRHSQPLPAPEGRFRDHVYRIRQQEESGLDAESRYWREKFNDDVPVIELPAQYPRPAAKTYYGREITQWIEAAQWQRLQRFCEQENATPFMGLFAVLNALVHRYTRQESTVIGTPVASRDEAGLQQQVGLLLNTLAIKTDFSGNDTFRQLLAIQRNELLQAYRHSRYPLDKLLRELPYRNDPSRSPLFDVMIVLHNQATLAGDTNPVADGLQIAHYQDLPKDTSQFDMSLVFFYEGDRLRFSLEYNTDIYADWFAQQFADHYLALLEQLLLTPDAAMNTVSYLSSPELEQLLLTSYQPFVPGEINTLPALMTHLEQHHGDHTAVSTGAEQLTYRELTIAARQVCHYLRTVAGVTRGETVGVLMTPALWTPAYVLGIWMAGGIYVPLNMADPEARIRLITTDAGCKTILTAESLSAIQDMALPNHMEWLEYPEAYLLYTSGTTGQPKGVSVGHRELMQKLQAEHHLLALQTPVNTCMITNYCFDVSFLELLLPLLCGGTIVVPVDVHLLQQEELAALLLAEKVNVLQGTPTFIESLFSYLPQPLLQALNTTLQVLCIGGESLNKKLITFLQQQLPAVKVNNHYGPTETVIDAVVKKDIRAFERNIIGWPLPGTRAYVLDELLQPLPAGVAGELCIGGISIANGYWKDAAKTAQKFVPNPFVSSEKLYRTGDLVKWTENGELEFIGRIDEQIKIRGLRVETEEIRRLLEQHPDVQQAVVYSHQHSNNTLLAAFVVPAADRFDEQKIKAHLRELLPDYMVPSLFTVITSLPYNRNGKINRQALIDQLDFSGISGTIVPPRNETERVLAGIWERLLGRSPVGVEDHFFDLGGNSMLLVKMRIDIRQALGIQLHLKELFRLTTIAQLADAITAMQWLQQPVEDIAGGAIEEISI